MAPLAIPVCALLVVLATIAGCGRNDAPPGDHRPPPGAARPPALPPDHPVATKSPSPSPADAPLVQAAGPSAERALSEGRRLSSQGRYAEAVAALERAVEAAPRDPVPRSEQGLALSRSGDADGAERMFESAIELYAEHPPTATPQREALARCLYNLGRVYEGKREWGRAVTHYRWSLQWRANEQVEQRLAGIAALAEPGGEWLRTCEAPSCPAAALASLASVERTLRERKCRESQAASVTAVACDARVRVMRRTQGSADLRSAAALVSDGSADCKGDGDVWITLETADGWYTFGPIVSLCGGMTSGSRVEVDVDGLDGVPGDASEVMLETRTLEYVDDGVRGLERLGERALTFCGVTGGRPACWGTVPVARTSSIECEDAPLCVAASDEYAVAIELGDDGSFELRRTRGSPPPGMLGRHEVRDIARWAPAARLGVAAGAR